jgi:hexokinase
VSFRNHDKKPRLNFLVDQKLFDFIALELAKFVSAQPGNDNDAPASQKKLGFTLSYPVDQAAASPGTAIKWKSFSADDMVESLFPHFRLDFSVDILTSDFSIEFLPLLYSPYHCLFPITTN